MIRQLIWDVDGTLFDTYPAFATAVSLALGEIDVTVSPDRILSLCKRSLNHCVVILASEFQADADDILAGFQRHYAALPAQEQPPFPGVIEICAYICSIGGSNFIVTHRGGGSLELLLTAHQMVGYFADRLTADDGYPRKPDPSSFEAMISRHHSCRRSWYRCPGGTCCWGANLSVWGSFGRSGARLFDRRLCRTPPDPDHRKQPDRGHQ
jgi:phosphoglycolate phosphatase-like HAD superfamily hydrolase